MNLKSDFISLFIGLTKEFESPTSFWKWSAYATIAATMRSNCYIHWASSKLYPNLYVLLLADSAAHRKDAGPELSSELLKECGYTKVIKGRASWQGIVDELSQDVGNKKTGVPIKGGAGIIIATEFTAAFVEDPNLIKLMTEGYAFEEEYEYILRGGKVKIKKRCITILGGSNETLLRDVFTLQASYGGLLRRTCLIKPNETRKPNSLMDDNTNSLTDIEKKDLQNKLKEIEKLNGRMTFSPEAMVAFDAWYKELHKSYSLVQDKTGFTQGLHALVAKLCMILTANQDSLVITEPIFTQSVNEIMSLKDNYTAYAMGSGKNPHAGTAGSILLTLWKEANNSLKRRDILLKHYNDISSEDLDKVMLTLESAGLVRSQVNGSEMAYQLTQLAKDAFLKNIQSKSQGIN